VRRDASRAGLVLEAEVRPGSAGHWLRWRKPSCRPEASQRSTARPDYRATARVLQRGALTLDREGGGTRLGPLLRFSPASVASGFLELLPPGSSFALPFSSSAVSSTSVPGLRGR
jgi:hypothetical protein